jgi:hypothetical protein
MTTGPRYRGRRLDAPLREFHLAVDRLRWDTVPTPLNHQPPSPRPTPPRRHRQDSSGGQVALIEEASCTSTYT